MNDSSNTTGAQRAPSWTPSIPSIHRRWSAISNAEQGQDAAAVRAEQAIEEEIDEIKRYEVREPFIMYEKCS
jgi:chloride channel 3/4/5